jgi:hypothetical protein
VIGVLTVSSLVWSPCLWGQTSEARKDPATPAAVRILQLDILSLQVTKLPRDQFGHGTKPDTHESVAFWVANSGTAVDLRMPPS